MKIPSIVLLAGFALTALPNSINADQLSGRFEQIFADQVVKESEILDPDQAFILSAEVPASDQLQFRWRIAEGYYLYRDNFHFSIESNDVTAGQPVISRGKIKQDPDFGRVEVIYQQAQVNLPLIKTKATELPINMIVTYQGCKEDVICYPPVNKKMSLLIPAGNNVITKPNAGPVKLSTQDSIVNKLLQGSLLINVLIFFGFGLLAAFTACVYPMIPILSGIIVGHGKQISTQKAFILSLAYVLPIALTYSIVGIIAAQLGYNLQAAAQNAWVLSVFSIVFVLLALSMFGFYELQLPKRWQTKLSELSNQQSRGSLYGAAIMGVLSAIIVGPCVTPPLFAGIAYTSQTGDILLGGLALFAFGLGLGAPLLVVGASMGKLLPRAGAWMDVIKKIFGVVMLGVAIWFIERVIPGPVALGLWALLFIVTAIYLGALDPLPAGASWLRLWKGLGLAMLVYGAVLIIGAAGGNDNMFKPLQGMASGTELKELEFKTIKSTSDLESELKAASKLNQVVMLDFYADWCIDCKKMERQTFSKAGVQMALKDVMLLKADVTSNDAFDQDLLNKFNLLGPPATLFFDRQGQEQEAYRIIGFIEADKFSRHVQQVVTL